MGLKSFLKGLDSRPTTPQIGSVPLPDLGASDDDASLKSKRPRTPSFFRKRILSPFRSGTPLKRAGSSSTTSSSNLSSLHVGDLSPLTVSEDGESERFFHIVPATPIPESPPPRHSTPKQVPRCETPKPTDSIPQHLVTNTTASSPVPSKPRSITRPDIPHGVHYSPPKPPLSARASTPAPPRSGYEPQRPLRRASTPAPRSPPAPEHQHHASPQPNANNALVLATHLPTDAELHWQLLQHDPARGKPRLYFDVSQEPALIRVFHKYMRPLMPDDKHKLAASVPLTHMTIRCAPLPLAAWDIRVRRHDGGSLRCMDVFEAIYESLSTPLSDAEKGQWTQEYLDSCEPVFKARCKASAALTDWEERQGLRRVDLLKGRTRFMGIARASPGKNYWVLHLDRQRSTPIAE